MKTQAKRRLSSLAEEIARAGAGLGVLREHLEARRSVVADLWARSLAAETPYADREFRMADQECRRVEERVREQEARLAALEAERDGLLRRLAGGGNPPG